MSERTKAALKQAKARGQQLGNRTTLGEATAKGAAANKTAAVEFARKVLPLIQQLQQGLSLRKIAVELKARKVQTARGGVWTARQVADVFSRAS